jgi:pimeloyl-ACP methyl ester carboxylesterase
MPDQPDAHGGAAHANTDATYVPLREGRAYRLCDGSPDGELLVLVHGATVPSWEFDALVPPLLRAGFRTLRFDLYGHGASDRPPGAYTFERFTRQLIEMLDVSGVRRATLLGHSFGAAVVAAVAAARR